MRFTLLLFVIVSICMMVDARRTGKAPKSVRARYVPPSTRTTTTTTTRTYTASRAKNYDPGRSAYGMPAYTTYINGGMPYIPGEVRVYMGPGTMDYGYYGNYMYYYYHSQPPTSPVAVIIIVAFCCCLCCCVAAYGKGGSGGGEVNDDNYERPPPE